MTFLNLSVSVPNQRPAGDATTRAPQSTVPAGSPSMRIPCESTLVTRALMKTSTPKFSSCRWALRERTSGYVGRMRGPASYRRTRADLGSICRKSCANAMPDVSASVPAISTPTVPAPTSANVRRRRIPQLGPVPRPGVLRPLLQPARTQAGFCFESCKHHREIRGQVRTDAIRHAQNSCSGCQSPG
jgi:hypothetical protein